MEYGSVWVYPILDYIPRQWLSDGFYVENARPANQSVIVTVCNASNGRPAGQNDP